jgi:peptidoglycan-N-acetylglucosamine deacetylase
MSSNSPPNTSESRGNILVTIDVEDWFQVENLKERIDFSCWDSMELRVEKNTHIILDLLDTVRTQRSDTASQVSSEPCLAPSVKIKGTFFVLGWVAKRLPSLVQEIQARGHEVASHGLDHQLCYQSSRDALKKEIEGSKKLLEDILGQRVYGYRAPSFSVTEVVLELLQESGYYYDSSVNSFGGNERYGKIDLSMMPQKGLASQYAEHFYELPISNLKLGGISVPIGGGGYFRLMPSGLFLSLVSYFLRREGAYLFYMHPWELDPTQPIIRVSSVLSRFKHYYNISQGHAKLKEFLERFSAFRFMTASEYLQSQNCY